MVPEPGSHQLALLRYEEKLNRADEIPVEHLFPHKIQPKK